jgi:hypothetical protein
MINNVYWSRVKYPLFFTEFNDTWMFQKIFKKILKYQILWKYFQWKPSFSIWTDGRTDRYKEFNNRFSQFYESA